MPTAESRDRRAADLRERAALVRRDGWALYAETWSSGEVAGVRAVLGEPGAVNEAVEQWAPTLWGTAAAEADARTGYRSTRRWFAAVAQADDDLEMTEAEKASLAASHAAIGDLAHALVEGTDPESADAALAAVRQAESQVDRQALLNKIHMPRDSEGFEDGLRAIMMRIPDGWGRWISCSRGWYPIIIQLDRTLAAIDAAYEVRQCKEKLGGLRYYFGASEGVTEADHQRMRTLVREAEARCDATCELCGEPGVRHARSSGWLKTLCPDCAAAAGYEPLGELVNDLDADRRGLWRVTCYGDGPDSHWDMTHGEVSLIDGERYRDIEVLAPPSVLRTWRIRLADGTEIESGLVAAIERVR